MIIDPGSPDLALERVELAFPELLPGFEAAERRVRFDGRDVADLLATAGERTLLVSLVANVVAGPVSTIRGPRRSSTWRMSVCRDKTRSPSKIESTSSPSAPRSSAAS